MWTFILIVAAIFSMAMAIGGGMAYEETKRGAHLGVAFMFAVLSMAACFIAGMLQ